MLDIAVPQPTGFPTAGAIEDCLCPRGYSGRSCELCSVGHFRDMSDRSRGPLGTCRPCECGGNEVSCQWDPSSRVGHRCVCRAGFAGERLVFTKMRNIVHKKVHNVYAVSRHLPMQMGVVRYRKAISAKPFLENSRSYIPENRKMLHLGAFSGE